MLSKLLIIAAGGAAGAVLRYLVAGAGQQLASMAGGGWATFPAGTFLVNVLGCLAIGFLAALFASPVLVREEFRLLLLVGLLGGFTTFSSFSLETLNLLREGAGWAAATNVLLSNAAGFLAVWAGYRLGERIYGV